MTSSIRGAKKEATRAKLIEAAHDFFAEKGYNDTNIREIAEAAGVSERTFYRYFETKDELLFPNLRTVISELLENLRNVAEGTSVMDAIEVAVKGTNLSQLPRIGELRAMAIGLNAGMVVVDVVRLIFEFELQFATEIERRLATTNSYLSELDRSTYALVLSRFIFGVFRSTMNVREDIDELDQRNLPPVQEHMMRVFRLMDPSLPPLT
ncbi:MAG: TetR family transcriptional regulator [Actinomycetota bacterium]|nr:TetR family transcriptional regulator [Actinomycetota bacterium]